MIDTQTEDRGLIGNLLLWEINSLEAGQGTTVLEVIPPRTELDCLLEMDQPTPMKEVTHLRKGMVLIEVTPQEIHNILHEMVNIHHGTVTLLEMSNTLPEMDIIHLAIQREILQVMETEVDPLTVEVLKILQEIIIIEVEPQPIQIIHRVTICHQEEEDQTNLLPTANNLTQELEVR